MNEELLIAEIGLLLTQTRVARRTLEDIERATATYGTFAFTSVIAAGPRFGEPPLFEGALKVHVVNISDLAPGSGIGGFLEGLLGGIGSFIGNLVGGIPGGFVGSLSLIGALPTIDSIAGRVERILTMLGVGAPSPPTGPGMPVEGSNLRAQLESIRRAIDSLTGLFLAAGGQPEAAAGTSNLPSTPEGERWRRLLDSASATLTALAPVVGGLIIALPIVVGSIASFIFRLGDIRLAIAETLQFALRNALLLRGAVAVTAFDTLAMVARVAASIVGILATTLGSILSAVFDTVRAALAGVVELTAALGDVVRSAVDALLNWLVPTVDTVLRNLGDLRVFRVITHVVRILPAILPPIFELAKDRPFPKEYLPALTRAAEIPFLDVGPRPSGAGGGATPVTPPPAPDIRAIVTDPTRVGRITGAVDRIQNAVETGLTSVRDTTQGGLTNLGTRLEAAAVAETRLSDTTLDRHLADVTRQSTELAGRLVVGERVEPRTGLETIARAYESWLSGGGLNTLLGNITRHFQGDQGRAGVPQRIVEGSMDRPRATIQIDEVIIDVGGGGTAPAAPPAGEQGPGLLGPGDFPLPPQGDDVERYARMWFDHRMRGGGSLLPLPT